jgi:hypothetical protein
VGKTSGWHKARNAALLFAAVFGACGFYAIQNDNLWWHLKLGEWVWTEHSLPAIGAFSQNAVKMFPFIEIGGSLALFLIYDWFGATGLIALRIMVLFATGLLLARAAYGPLLRASRVTYFRSAAMFVSLGLVGAIILPFAKVDTRLFSLFFVALFLFILRREERRPRSRLLWLLPVAELMWAHLDRCAAIGMLLVFSQVLRTFFRVHYKVPIFRLGVIGVLCGLALLSNPNGLHLVFVPARDLLSGATQSFLLDQGQTLSIRLILEQYPTFLLITFLWAIPWKKTSTHSLPERLPGVCWLMLTYWTTMIPFVAIALLPGIARRVEGLFIWQLGKRHDRLGPTATVALSTFAGLMMLFYTYSVTVPDHQRRIGFSEDTPVHAVQFLKEKPIKGNMYNSRSLGGHLLFSLAPDKKVFADGRGAEKYYAKEFLVDLAAAKVHRASWEKLTREKNITWAVFRYRAGEDNYAFIHENPDWHLVYWDDVAAIVVKDTPETEDYIAQHAYQTIRVSSAMKRIANWDWSESAVLLADLRKNVADAPHSQRARTLLELAEHSMVESGSNRPIPEPTVDP